MVENQSFDLVFVGIIVIGDLLWLLAGLQLSLTLASMMQKGSSLLRTARHFLCKGPITDILLLVIFLSMITILLIKYKRKLIMLTLPLQNFDILYGAEVCVRIPPPRPPKFLRIYIQLF